MHPEFIHPTRKPTTARRFEPTKAAAWVQEGRASRLPADWIHDGGLRAFRGDAGYVGRSIAALKLYLTLVVSQDAAAPAADPTPITLSYERIAELSGLSDPLICAGKKALRDQGLVTTCGERPAGATAYRLTGLYPSAASASILHTLQVDTRIAALHELACRKGANLAVLKTYLLLSAGGRDPDGVVSLDLDAAASLTALSHVKVAAALGALQDLGLADAPGSPSRLSEQRRVRLLPLQ